MKKALKEAHDALQWAVKSAEEGIFFDGRCLVEARKAMASAKEALSNDDAPYAYVFEGLVVDNAGNSIGYKPPVLKFGNPDGSFQPGRVTKLFKGE